MNRPLFWIGFSYIWTLWLLSLTGAGFAKGLLMVAGLSFLLEFSLWLHHKKTHNAKEVGIVPAACLACAVACSLYLVKLHCSVEPALALCGSGKQVEGVVTKVLSDTAAGHRYVVKQGGVRVLVTSRQNVLSIGDVLSLRGKLYELKPYYWHNGTYIGTYAYDGITVTGTKNTLWVTALRRVNDLRHTLSEGLSAYLSDDLAGVLNGMVLGDKTLLSDEQKECFQRAGVLHLFAVSGFHTSLWSMLVYRGMLKLGLHRRVACVGGILFTLFFMALTGFSASGLRAELMLILFFLGTMTVLHVDSLNSLGAAILLLTLPNPFSGGNTGLMLSFFATLGVLVLLPPLQQGSLPALQQIRNPALRQKALDVWSLMLISLSAICFTLPCSVFTFGSVSFVAPLSNLLISSAASTAILLGGIGALFGRISLVSRPVLFFAGLLVRFINGVCTRLSTWRCSLLSMDTGGMGLALAGCLLICALTLIFYYSEGERKGATVPGSLPRTAVLLCLILLLGSVLSYDLFCA